MQEIRILFITHYSEMDGANRSMLQLIEELRSNHFVVPMVVCPPTNKKGYSIITLCKEKDITCYTLPIVHFKQTGIPSTIYRIRTFLSELRWNLYLIYQLKDVKFDLVYSNSSIIDMGAYLAMARKVPHIWHLREFGEEDFHMSSVLGKRYEKWIYSKCTYAIAISQAIRDKFKPYFNDRLLLIYNGIVSRPDTLASLHQNKKFTFCMVGRIEANKNQLEAIKACAILRRKTNLAFKLLIIGKGSEEYVNLLKEKVDMLGIAENIQFVSYQKDISLLLKQCDVGLTLSTSEAFGRVTIEYMVQNLAVIASNSGANPEIVTDGSTGLLYELGNAEQLADKMKSLLENRSLLEEIASNGRQFSLSHFTSIQNSEKIFGLIQSTLRR